MSLNFYLTRTQPTVVFDRNITHNLTRMADEAGIYKALWRPEEKGYTKAEQIISILREGLELLESDPERFKKFNSPNGWEMLFAYSSDCMLCRLRPFGSAPCLDDIPEYQTCPGSDCCPNGDVCIEVSQRESPLAEIAMKMFGLRHEDEP